MNRQLKICLMATECGPFLREGGLADAISGLADGLTAGGDGVWIILPLYGSAVSSREEFADTGIEFEIAVGGEADRCRFRSVKLPGKREIFLVENERYFGSRKGFYGENGRDYPDNLRRFVFYSEAALYLLRSMGSGPDIIHCHNWQTGFIPAYLKYRRGESDFFSRTASVFTVHNLAFQGLFPGESMPLTNLPWGAFNPAGIEFFGQINPTKAGLLCSHAVTLTGDEDRLKVFDDERGYGLEGVLRRRRGDLSFIECGGPGISPEERRERWAQAAADYRQVYLKALKKLREQSGL